MIKIHQSSVTKSNKVRVTFSMPAMDYCDGLYLVGWFSEWDESVYPMDPTADGGWAITLELEMGCTYQYRFRTLDGRWLNDPAPASPARYGFNSTFIISRSAISPSNTRPRSAPPS